MKKPQLWITGIGAVAALAAVMFMLTLHLRADDAGLEVRSKMVVGHELRLIVETYRRYTPPLSHSSKTADAKGWFLIVDLNSPKPLPERTQVFGPLWDVPEQRSSLSFDAGAFFTQQDIDAANATPWCVLDAHGALLRFTLDPATKAMVRDEFLPAAKGGAWKRQGAVMKISDATRPMSEDRLVTPSGQFVLLYQNGKAELFDRFTGEAKADPWLTGSFAQARAIKDFGNVKYFLTDDLNHLVASPASMWNTGGKLVKTFDFGGTTYTRAEVGIAYSRPDPAPRIFRRNSSDNFLAQEPHAAFSIDKLLYLFMHDEKSLRLYTPDGQKKFLLNATGQPEWPTYPFVETQQLEQENQLVIYGSDDMEREVLSHEIILNIWSYKRGSMEHKVIALKELFESSLGQLRPKSAVQAK
jgi:hypothetical protein